MALWVCAGEAGCGTRYAVGLFRCPRCHNEEFHEDGDPMGKISRHAGASVAAPGRALPAEDAAAAETDPAPEAAADQPETVEWLDVTEHVAGPAEAVAEPEESAEPPAEEPDYESWTVEQLKEQLGARGLPKTGKRDDLVLRLMDDDTTPPSNPE